MKRNLPRGLQSCFLYFRNRQLLLLTGCLCSLLAAVPVHVAAQNYPNFEIRNYMGRCMSFSTSRLHPDFPPVYITDCDHSSGQQIGIEELPRGEVVSSEAKPVVNGITPQYPNEPHEVRLHAGSMCIDPVTVTDGLRLELRACRMSNSQFFVLDGDSIIAATNRDLVVQLSESVTKVGTAAVLGHRQLSDVEFWDLTASDNSGRKPTSGFFTASQASDLMAQLTNAIPNTVIELTPDTDIQLYDLPAPFLIPSGVTVRGNRRGILFGAQLWIQHGHNASGDADAPGLFKTTGSNARITALRMKGPSRDPNYSGPALKGLNLDNHYRTVVDHNDISDWTLSAIDTAGWDGEPRTCQAPTEVPVLPEHRNLHISRNLIHHNDAGYGVAAGSGAIPLISGNVFLINIHSVTSDGFANSGFAAQNNLFLTGNVSADVDVHGNTLNSNIHDGGIGGAGVYVDGNTFFRQAHLDIQENPQANGYNGWSFSLRGYACSGALDTFYDNVVAEDVNSAIAAVVDSDPTATSIPWTLAKPHTPFLRVNSKFSMPDPAHELAVGDFDGDGKNDLFMATGAGWYYSPRGNAEWRFLSAKTETVDTLFFGDFDGDGRTDVFTQIGDNWMISWGGRSDWKLLSTNHGQPGGHPIVGMLNFYVGDFVGDSRADVFYTDGFDWYVSDGGVGPLLPYAQSSFRVEDLAFGHFDAKRQFGDDSKLDVVGVVQDDTGLAQWMVVYAQTTHNWQLLRPGTALTRSMKDLIVADFDGDGTSDIAIIHGDVVPNGTYNWEVSRNGRTGWERLADTTGPSPFAGVGNFDDTNGADILYWSGNSLNILSGGTGAPQLGSRQAMK